ncbi:hypothetical protein [Mycobacteroides chelonae]|nr:hypothetical protein [Mycobacteroides chelonae]MBF9325142.1 hypothetical protein [Mycobacteroides chelonae]MBF9419318.1 hypothetical protein [Mycobacteroides chelonae]MBV6359098.1 hypothetical protein [Mycobacteroides chelonae]MEC4835297.1 hypothetical protein [Mycobacteroides chelonae]MEC4872277.1 hypothetical protein [Mycobacteroides chelonae]
MADDSETEPGPAVASVTGMTARIGVREYFASELLWNANYLVEMAEAREAALLGEGFRGVDRVLRAQVVSSIFQSVAFLEAYANGVWGDAAVADPTSPPSIPQLTGLSTDALRRLKELWNTQRVERALSVVEKFQVALTCVNQDRIDMGSEPGQTVAAMIRLRNDLMHFKPKTNWSDEQHHLQQVLQPRLGVNPLTNSAPWFPHQVLTPKCARLAYEAVRAFGAEWRTRMGIDWGPASEHTGLTDQIPTD